LKVGCEMIESRMLSEKPSGERIGMRVKVYLKDDYFFEFKKVKEINTKGRFVVLYKKNKEIALPLENVLKIEAI